MKSIWFSNTNLKEGMAQKGHRGEERLRSTQRACAKCLPTALSLSLSLSIPISFHHIPPPSLPPSLTAINNESLTRIPPQPSFGQQLQT